MVISSPALTGKVALVTGASRGIGRAIALRLAESGTTVAATGRDTVLLATLIEQISAAGGVAHAFPADLTQEGAASRLLTQVIAQHGKLHILVNSAGATKRGDFLEQSDRDWQDGFGLKLFAAVRLTRLAWPHLQQANGAVLNIAGIGARTPHADFAIGASVNAAFNAFTKALAARGITDGVRVNAINPGAVRTDRFQRRLDVIMQAEQLESAAAEAHFVARSAISRVGEPADVAALAAFILSDQGTWLQGALLDIDGGETKSL